MNNTAKIKAVVESLESHTETESTRSKTKHRKENELLSNSDGKTTERTLKAIVH